MTWLDIFDRWDLVDQDLQDIGIDMGDGELMRTRNWPWLRRRIAGLASRPQSIRLLGHDEHRQPVIEHVYANRLQAALYQTRG